MNKKTTYSGTTNIPVTDLYPFAARCCRIYRAKSTGSASINHTAPHYIQAQIDERNATEVSTIYFFKIDTKEPAEQEWRFEIVSSIEASGEITQVAPWGGWFWGNVFADSLFTECNWYVVPLERGR